MSNNLFYENNAYPLLKPSVKKKWLAALRQPVTKNKGYLQGRGRLVVENSHDGEDKFCCLGVLQNEMEGFAAESNKFSISSKSNSNNNYSIIYLNCKIDFLK